MGSATRRNPSIRVAWLDAKQIGQKDVFVETLLDMYDAGAKKVHVLWEGEKHTIDDCCCSPLVFDSPDFPEVHLHQHIH